jgi:hypothetical protein
VQCPNRPYLVPIEHENNALTAANLLPWFDKRCPPHKNFLEFTGAETSLHPECDYIISELDKRGYYGIIKTNGLRYIPKTKGFIRIGAWHSDISNPPKYFDRILILTNPDDDWESKVKYCEENNIEHSLGAYVYFWGSKAGQCVDKVRATRNDGWVKQREVQFFENYGTIFSNGDLVECPMTPKRLNPALCDIQLTDEEKKNPAKNYDYIRSITPLVQNMSPLRLKTPCNTCSNVIGCESVLDYDMRRFLKKREQETNYEKSIDF